MADETRSVLVVTGMDMTADAVIEELHARNVPVARFDLADFEGRLTMTARFENGQWLGSLETPYRRVDLTQARSLYYRRPTSPPFDDLPTQDAEFARQQARHGFSGVLQSLSGCLYVNSPRRSAAEWKAAQLRTAGGLGFDVPLTLITNSPDDAVEFAKAVGPIVYKPTTHVTYTVDGDPRAVWVREVDPSELDESISVTAHMFQAKVDKVADIRVTVVGDQVFCVRIDSPLVDWRERYDLIQKHTPIDPPRGLDEKVRAYLDAFGLVYGCFDFGLGHDGTWWWYECNPAGEWGWIEAETGLPISAAFADVLERGLS